MSTKPEPEAETDALPTNHKSTEIGELVRLPLNDIQLPPWAARQLDEAIVEALCADLAQGLLVNPITVRRVPGGFGLVCGNHRIEAARRLRWEEVPVRIVDLDDQQAEAASLSENLWRATLDGDEQDRAMNRLRILYGGAPAQDPAVIGSNAQPPARAKRGTQKRVAAATGRSEAAVSLAKAREERLAPAVREAIAAGTIKVAIGTELLGLSADAQTETLPLVIKKSRAEVRQIASAVKAGKRPAIFAVEKTIEAFKVGVNPTTITKIDHRDREHWQALLKDLIHHMQALISIEVQTGADAGGEASTVTGP